MKSGMGAAARRERARAWPRVRVGRLWIDALRFDEAASAIEAMVDARRGGSVFTPNLDHIVNAEENAAFADAYSRASLSLVDGQPLVWASRLLGLPLPEKISGSDLAWPVLQLAARRGFRVYLLGGAEGAAAEVARRCQSELGLTVCGVDAPRIEPQATPGDELITARIAAARPDLVLVALGSPKQELWIDRTAARLSPAVQLGVGASLDFLAGKVRRAPRWMQRAGLEWLYRLAQEPGRLWRRYLINDPKFLLVLSRTLREERSSRILA